MSFQRASLALKVVNESLEEFIVVLEHALEDLCPLNP